MRDAVELERHRFKSALVAAHPEHAEALVNAVDQAEGEQEAADDAPFTAEEITQMMQVTDTILEQIRESGFAVEDM